MDLIVTTAAASNQTVIPIFDNQTLKKDKKEKQKTVDQKIQNFIKHEYGTKKNRGFFNTISAYMAGMLNKRTTIKAASRNWDKERLINGKIKQFQEIGGEGVRLQTKSGDSVVGCYFSLSNFYQKIKDIGGRPVRLRFKSDHPFIESAEPVILSAKNGSSSVSGVRIPYHPNLEEHFRNPKDFITFCKNNDYKVLWEDTLSEMTPSGYFFSSRKKNIILVKISKSDSISQLKSSEFEVKKRNAFNQTESLIFDFQITSDQAILFEKSKESLEKEFKKNLILDSADYICWDLISYGSSTILIKDLNLSEKIQAMTAGELNIYPLIDLEIDEIETLNLEKTEEKGVVVIAPHQTTSSVGSVDEICKFLLMGMNVLVYDHPGVALSKGYVSEKGLREAVFSVGDFLTKQLKFNQKQIVFKGECGGGIIVSEACKRFPNAHIWADQSPQNYWGSTKSFLRKAVKKLKDEKGIKSKITSMFFQIGLHQNFYCPVSLTMGLVLPKMDLLENFKNCKGTKIYTIGVPDANGKGGDDYVPQEHQQKIRETLNSIKNESHFIEMPSFGHITHHWWALEDVEEEIYQILQEKNLLHGPFGNALKKEKELSLPEKEISSKEGFLNNTLGMFFKKSVFGSF